jgi:hypothetical protein
MVGQRAMVYALAHPETEKGGRGQKASGDRTVSNNKLQKPAPLHEAPDLVAGVVAGEPSLAAAFDQLQRRRRRWRGCAPGAAYLVAFASGRRPWLMRNC